MFLFLFVLLSQITSADEWKSRPDYHHPPDSIIVHEYDVLHYDIDIAVDYPYDSVAGICTMQARATQNIDSVELHLGMVMYIDSLMIDGVSASFNRLADTLYIELPNTIYQDQIFEVMTSYHGKPDSGYYYNNKGFYTQTQPVQASKQWFPCYDWCWDKADSGVSVHVTVPDSIYAVSNGVLDSIDTLGGNMQRFHWDHHHPITTYLIAVAAYDYVIIERNFMGYPLIYYVIPGYENVAQNMLDSCEIILTWLDTLIAPYPFADEKLGQCHAYGTGAMEHQTCIEYGFNSWNNPITHAHEIIHQWYGNDVTCINYGNMFLNEGTTEYYECLSILLLRGIEAYIDGLIYRRNIALETDSAYHWTIINNPNPFYGGCVYYKGCWFHHMLRNLMGDSLYFPAMREYYQIHRGGNVSVTDLQNVMESYYQDSLRWFFYQWLEETDHPVLNMSWFYNNDTLIVNITQVQTHGPSVFRIPVELGVWLGDSCTVHGPYWMEDSANLAVNIVCSEPDSITIDPNIKLYYKLDGFIPMNNILIVDDDNGGNFEVRYEAILDLLNISHYIWDCNQQGLPPDFISNYVKAIFWITGDEVNPLSQSDRDKIRTIIVNEVPIVIFSPKAAEQLQGTTFLSDTLGCQYSGSTTNITAFIGTSGDPIGDNCQWFTIPIHNSSDVTPSSNGYGSVYWDSSYYGIIRNHNMSLVFSTIDLKYIYNQVGYNSKERLIANILNYLGIQVSVAVEEIAETPVNISDNSIQISYLENGTISFHLTTMNPTEFFIYDISGRIVQSWDIEGESIIQWRGEDINGRLLPKGRYFAVLKNNPSTKQIILFQ